MVLSASCAGHTRTQSHAALYKINNEVVVGWWHQITNVGLSECEVMDDTYGTYDRSALTSAQTSLSTVSPLL